MAIDTYARQLAMKALTQEVGKEEQSKSITIKNNGVIQVLPDEGKALSDVRITTDVPKDNKWQPEPDWWDIETVYNEFKLEHPEYAFVAVFLLMSDGEETNTINSYDASISLYKSDGEYIDMSDCGYGKTKDITWDVSKDKYCSRGYKTRYIIIYSKKDISSWFYAVTRDYYYGINHIYVIADSTGLGNFGGGGSSCNWSRRPFLEAVKFMTNGNPLPTHIFFGANTTDGLPSLKAVLSDEPLKFHKKYTTESYNSMNLNGAALKYPLNIQSYPSDVKLRLFSSMMQCPDVVNISPDALGTGEYLCSNLHCRHVNMPKCPVDMDYIFTNSSFYTINEDNILDCSGATSMYKSFNPHSGLTHLTLLNTDGVTDFDYLLNNESTICRLTIDVSGATRISNAFNTRNLKEINFINEISASMVLSTPPISTDNILHIIEHLKDLTGGTTKTLTLGSSKISKLTAEQIAVATDKNWTVK